MVTTRNVTASLLIYDIPEDSKMPNPSPDLRRLAVRVNLSCWVIPNHLIPHSLLNEIDDNGGVWHVVKFDASEADTLLQMASRSLRADVQKAVKSCEESVRSAAVKSDEVAEEDAVKGLTKYLRSTGQAIRRTEKLLSDYRAAAEGFGVEVVSLGIGGALTSIQGIQTGVKRQAAVYKRLAEEAREIGSDGDALANALEAGEGNVGATMDYIQENGGDVTVFNETFAELLRPAV